MGFSTLHWLKKHIKMKIFAAAFLVAAAFAEPEAKADADPALLYGGFGYAGLGYAGYAGYPYAYGAYPYAYGAHYFGKRSADAEPEAKADAALLYGALGYGAHYIGKRSADAEPKADAAYLYGAYGYAGHYGYVGYPYAYGAYPYSYGYLG